MNKPSFKAYYTMTLQDGRKVRKSVLYHGVSLVKIYTFLVNRGYEHVQIFPAQAFHLDEH